MVLGVAVVACAGHQGGRRPQVAGGAAGVGRAVVAWVIWSQTTTPATETRVSEKIFCKIFVSQKKYFST